MDLILFLASCVFWGSVWGTLGALIGQGKGRRKEGALLGIFLGPLGLLLAVFYEPAPPVYLKRIKRLPAPDPEVKWDD